MNGRLQVDMLKPSDCPDYQQFQDIFISEIIQDSGEIGEFQLGNLYITINNLTTYEKNLI